MTNSEKYLKEDVDPSNLIESFIRYYYEHKEEESDLGKSFVKYMNEKTILTLTENGVSDNVRKWFEDDKC